MSNWGRWGADDEAGALNLVGPSQAVRAVGLVQTGQVVSLGQPLGPATPGSPHRKKPERYMSRDGGDYAAGARRPDGFQFAEDVVSFASHSGTHLDALSHAFTDDVLYNGFSSHTVRSTSGAARCGAEHLRPIVTRGVLLDVARERPLASGAPVTAQDLQRAAGDVVLEPGDAVLVRTGWLGSAGADYFTGEPGIDVGAAAWLAAADVALVGCDNYAVEVQPSAPGTSFPAHLLLIQQHGVPLMEGVVLDELAGVGRTTFLFISCPVPLVGSTAAPVCPIAVL